MPASEFDIIERFFRQGQTRRDDVVLGIGDDAAELRVAPGQQVVADMGLLIEGRDFQLADPPASLGHRALALALARLAARGAEPAWATLALTLPEADESWLKDFSEGLLSLARRYGMQLVGGDTTHGPAALTLHCHGLVPEGHLVPADGAAPGDLIYVVGRLGASGLAILALAEEVRLSRSAREAALAQLYLPEPPLPAAPVLQGLATACLPVAEGLPAALETMTSGHGGGATVHVEQLPISDALHEVFDRAGGWNLPLYSAEPCALCVTVPADRQQALEQGLAGASCEFAWVGNVESTPGVRCL